MVFSCILIALRIVRNGSPLVLLITLSSAKTFVAVCNLVALALVNVSVDMIAVAVMMVSLL
jgi:hypothetical protein